MIHYIDKKNIRKDLLGAKASSLHHLVINGFNVPQAFVLDKDHFIFELSQDTSLSDIRALYHSESDVNDRSKKILKRLEDFSLSSDTKELLLLHIDPNKEYAIRSSASFEDLEASSFAGQYETTLHAKGIDEIILAIEGCYRSLFSLRSLAYLERIKNFQIEDLTMSVIIQDMVRAKASGVLFSAHPVKGLDSKMAVEMVKGTGDKLVSGMVNPMSFDLAWFEEPDDLAKQAFQTLDLSQAALETLKDDALAITSFFGYPCDIEFSFDMDGRLWILQARPISKFQYDAIEGLWTTADFKDGGVSATVCHQYMWSLYELAWDKSLRSFMKEGKLQEPSPDTKLSTMYFARPYWNLDVVKAAMKKVPGFKERAFDEDYGIQASYEGDGHETKFTPANILRFIPIMFAQNKLLKERMSTTGSLRQELLDRLSAWHRHLDDLKDKPLSDIEDAWQKIQFDFYLRCEMSYFYQIFLNTIHQTRIRDILLKQMDQTSYLKLLGGLDEVSHLLPFYDLWEISRTLNQDATLSDIEQWLKDYGYHSEKELDVSYPNYMEKPEPILNQLNEMRHWPDSLGPKHDKAKADIAYDDEMNKLKQRLGTRKANKIEHQVATIRQLLWWREEFRDISTRCYDLIRKSAVLLAERYVERGILNEMDDIWHLKIKDIKAFMDKQLSLAELKAKILEQKLYYSAYENFQSDNEIPPATVKRRSINADERPVELDQTFTCKVTGTPANPGKVLAKAKVIRDASQMDLLEPGDILVTKFTDTGWTVKFAILSGIITEYGGVLSHAAIVAREYGIPCVVAAEGAMDSILDQELLYLDGQSGQAWQK